MSSAETQNFTARYQKRVIFGVVIEGVYSPLPLSLFSPDSPNIKNDHCSQPSGDLLPPGFIPYLSVYR